MTQTTIRYKQRRKITKIKEFTEKQYVSGSGPTTVFREVSRGWGVTFDTFDTYFVGTEKPAFKVGQYINFIIEGTIDAEVGTAETVNADKTPPNRG